MEKPFPQEKKVITLLMDFAFVFKLRITSSRPMVVCDVGLNLQCISILALTQAQKYKKITN